MTAFILFLSGISIIIGSVIYSNIGGGVVGAVVMLTGLSIGYRTGGEPE